MPQETRRTVASFSAHNVSGNSGYNKLNYPANFSGTTNHDGTVLAIDPTLEDNSQNPSAGFVGGPPPMVLNKKGAGGGSFRDLLPANFAGKIAQYATPWWGSTGHPNIGINDKSAADAKRILQDMQDRGIDVWFIDWYGQSLTSGAPDDSVVDVWVANMPPGMTFCIDINRHLINGMSSAAAQQTALINAINHLLTKYAGNPAYERVGSRLPAMAGRPLMPLWDMDAAALSGFDWNAVRSSVSANANGNPVLLHYQQPGFSKPQSDGAWSWFSSGSDTQADPSGAVSYLGFFLGGSGALAFQNLIIMSSACAGFNGTLTGGTGPAKSGFNSWSLGKYIAHQAGRTWKKWWDINASYVQAGHALDYIHAVWDDYEEGNQIQQGIRVDTRISAAINAAQTVVSFSKTDGGDELNVLSYNLWGSTDGVNAILLASVTPGQANQFDLTNLTGLSQTGRYNLYVEAAGFAGMQNIMAPQMFPAVLLTVKAGSGTLQAQLTISPGSGVAPLPITASGSQSTGSIVTYAFDFGDGSAPVSGPQPSAQHTYLNPGTFLVKLTVTDSSNATSQTSASVIVSGSGQPPTPTATGPTAVFSATPLSGNLPLTVSFDASESFEAANGAAITEYAFDFGDGQNATSALATQSHTYTRAGTFLVTLRVLDADNQVGQTAKPITAIQPNQNAPQPNPTLPPPPPPPVPPVVGDPKNPIKPVTPTPIPTPDPRRTICQRFKTRFLKK